MRRPFFRDLAALSCIPYIWRGTRKDYAMAMEAHDIEMLIRRAFPDAAITITDLAGDGNHYAAEVIDESFRGKNRVQQQRAVYAALQGKMDGPAGELHALALTTKAPD
ncbi:MAG: BolA family transcriptional regulator [Flavobacteriales bacterium]|nr:BolA family transcriptional regulator [Flavobacteriales bacterium]